MSSALEKLTFSILLLDNLSKPVQGVCKSLQKLQKASSGGLQSIKYGVAGIVGMNAGFGKLTGSARDFEKAIGEVRSLGTLEGDLESLTAASKKFTNRFGGDATAFVRSAYDIQSAIPGLKKDALAAFTYSGNLLAKSTKADAATITKFQGTMYNIFEKSANRIGQAKWVEALTGKTAHAIKIFKSSGNDMSAAFTNLGSIGEKAGVSLDEQLAVLGQLQGTMGGANAGTAYKAFLNKVGKAKLTTRSGETLKFTDQSGKLLPMVQILEKIRKAVGPGQLKLADQTALMTAFGDEGGKAVLNLLDKTDSLKQSIGELGKIQNADPAVGMAADMTDALERFHAAVKNISITLGRTLLPLINTVLNFASGIIGIIDGWMNRWKLLRWAIGGVLNVVLVLFSAFYGFQILRGATTLIHTHIKLLIRLYRMLWVAAGATRNMTFWQKISIIWHYLWGKATAFAKLCAGGFVKALVFMKNAIVGGIVWQKISSAAQLFWGKTAAFAAVCAGNFRLALMLMKTQFLGLVASAWTTAAAFVAGLVPALIAATAAAWAFTIAMLANPITWIVVAVIALIAGMVLLVVYWDKIKEAAIACWDWICSGVMTAFTWLKEKLLPVIQMYQAVWNAIGNAVAGAWDAICSGAKSVYDWLAEKLLPVIQVFQDAWSGITDAIAPVIGWFSKIFGGKTAGIEVSEKVDLAGGGSPEPVVPAITEARRRRDPPAGGVTTNSRTTNWGGVSIYAPNGMTPGQLNEWAALQA